MSDLSSGMRIKAEVVRGSADPVRTSSMEGGGGVGVYWRIFEIGWPDFPEILAPVGDPNFSRGPASPIPCFEGHRSLCRSAMFREASRATGASTAGALLITSC
jgi:hypothetical protein